MGLLFKFGQVVSEILCFSAPKKQGMNEWMYSFYQVKIKTNINTIVTGISIVNM